MNQPRGRELLVPLLPQHNKRLLRDAVLQMLVVHPVLLDRHEWDRILAAIGRVVVACPDLDLLGHAQESETGRPEARGVSSGEITPCRSNVGVEDGIATENVVLE